MSIKDRAIDAFSRPFATPTIGAAVRAFSDAINDPTQEMNKHPDDYDLHELGDFDDSTGEIFMTGPIQVAIGKQFIIKKD